jgi:hypothetical protein
MKIHLKNIFKALVLAVAIAACTEPMDLELDSTFTRLVVEGAITTDTGVHRIHLTKTTDFYHQGSAPGVSGASVRISDGQQIIELNENPYGSGVYETPDGFFGEVGKSYTLMVELEEDLGNHRNFTASSLLRPTAQPDSIQIVYQPTWGEGFWEIRLFMWDPPTEDFYKFLTYINNVLITDSLQEVFVLGDRFFNGNNTNGFSAGFLNAMTEDNRISAGDTVTLMVANLTIDHARFLATARTENGFNTPLFSGPPANVQGNIDNGAIGYFAAYQPRYVSRVYDGK